MILRFIFKVKVCFNLEKFLLNYTKVFILLESIPERIPEKLDINIFFRFNI